MIKFGPSRRTQVRLQTDMTDQPCILVGKPARPVMRRSGESRLGRLAGGAVARWEDRLATAHGSLAGRRGRAWVAALAGGSLLAGFCAVVPAVGAVGRDGARPA